MSADLLKATLAKAPSADAITSPVVPSGVLRFTSSVANASNAMPRTASNDWRGAEVEIKNESVTAGDIVWVLFSQNAGITLVVSAAAAGGDPLQTRGEPIFPGERIRRRIPPAPPGNPANGDVFFNRIASANTPAISIARIG